MKDVDLLAARLLARDRRSIKRVARGQRQSALVERALDTHRQLRGAGHAPRPV